MPNYKRKVRRAARRQGVRPELLDAQINAESGYNPNAVSPAGARGIAQFMPGTAKSYGVNLYDNNPNDDIRGAAKLMGDLLRQFGGDERKALAAYNAGAAAVQKYGGVPPFAETQNYVKKILTQAGHGGSRSPTASYGTQTTPGVDNSAQRQGLLQRYVLDQGNPDALLQLAMGLRGAQDVAGTTRRVRTPGSGGSLGKVSIAPGADRPGVKTDRKVVRFVRQVAGLYGQPLTIGTGTNHSQMTVNGNVSAHWTGRAADVPLRGSALVKAGQDALIAAGMPARKARKQTGGLFNVNGYQIIFNTQEGGDHTDHLHIGLRS